VDRFPRLSEIFRGGGLVSFVITFKEGKREGRTEDEVEHFQS
jgi:hypothetical protein